MLTVGADRRVRPRRPSSPARSPAIDLAAPGAGHDRRDPDALRPERLRDGRRHELLGPARLGRGRGGLDASGPTLTNTQLFEVMRRSAARRRQAGLGRGHRLRHPRRPGRADAQAAARRPAGAERGHRPRAAERPHARGQDAAHGARTGRARRSPRSLERHEDPEDVYRVYLPAKGKVVRHGASRPRTSTSSSGARRRRRSSSAAAAARRDLLGVSAHAGREVRARRR